MNTRDPGVSWYLDHLPAVYSEDAEAFLGRFLLAFERVLSGIGDANTPGLEEILDGIVHPESGEVLLGGIERYCDPGPGRPDTERAPAGFLEWLAGWVAQALRDDWDEPTRRRMIAAAVSSYRKRGTREGLRQVLAAYTGLPESSIDIFDYSTSLQLGVTSSVGVDTALGHTPHHFRVRMLMPVAGPGDLARRTAIARAIIDREKPAHTYYSLLLDFYTLQVGVRSKVGIDTLLGNVAGENQARDSKEI